MSIYGAQPEAAFHEEPQGVFDIAKAGCHACSAHNHHRMAAVHDLLIDDARVHQSRDKA
jgi:hypothetical protein